MTATTTPPESHVDIFSDDFMADPYPVLAELRAAGAVVRLPDLDAWAVTRFEPAREVLGNWERFSSSGVAFNDAFNQQIGEGVLRASPPLHTDLRGVLGARLSPRAMKSLREDIDQRATELVDRLLERPSIDAIDDLARRFPLDIVADLIGLPQEGREDLLRLVDANFNCFGPGNARTWQSMPQMGELAQYVMRHAARETFAPGSWGAAIYDAVDAGQVSAEHAPWLLMTYVTAGIDTTVHAIGHTVWLMGRHPEQWDLVRADHSLIPQAFREVLRLESPVQAFGRVTTDEWTVDGIIVPAGSQLAVLFGSANRDEQHWPDPDRFDVTRRNSGHLAFGYGLHACAGQALARTEGEAVLKALVDRVSRIETGEPVRHYNNVLRGLESLPTILTPA